MLISNNIVNIDIPNYNHKILQLTQKGKYEIFNFPPGIIYDVDEGKVNSAKNLAAFKVISDIVIKFDDTVLIPGYKSISK